MAGGIGMGQALQLMSGVPLKKVGTVFLEKLSATKRLDGGALGSLMGSVLQNGDLSSVMQNPMGALTSAVQAQASAAVSQLQGMISGAPAALVSALQGGGGLAASMSALQAAGNHLSGLTAGASGFFAMLGHETMAGMAGSALPPTASLERVTAPIASGEFLTGIAEALPGVIGQVVAGSMPVATAVTWVQGKADDALAIVSGSASALAWGQAMQPLISTVSSVAGSLAVPPVFDAAGNRQEGAPTGFQGVLASLVLPEARAAMDAALAAQIAHIKPERVDVAKMTSLDED